MVRVLGPETQTELNRRVTTPVQFIKLQTESNDTILQKRQITDTTSPFYVGGDSYDSTIRLTTNIKEITNPSDERDPVSPNNQVVYSPANNVISASPVEETQDIKANAINLTLSGIPNTIIGHLEETDAVGGIVTIWQGLIDDDGELTDDDVYPKWQGIVNSISTDEENADSGDINITVECKSRIGAILSTKAGTFTSDSALRQDYVDNNPRMGTETLADYNIRVNANYDKSFEFVASMVDFNPSFGSEE